MIFLIQRLHTLFRNMILVGLWCFQEGDPTHTHTSLHRHVCNGNLELLLWKVNLRWERMRDDFIFWLMQWCCCFEYYSSCILVLVLLLCQEWSFLFKIYLHRWNPSQFLYYVWTLDGGDERGERGKVLGEGWINLI